MSALRIAAFAVGMTGLVLAVTSLIMAALTRARYHDNILNWASSSLRTNGGDLDYLHIATTNRRDSWMWLKSGFGFLAVSFAAIILVKMNGGI